MRWQEMEYYAFIHFSLNTYTNQAWGFGDEDINLFNPGDLDCRQWARICKEAGMKGIIITAKHHSGFCLWPSEYTEYSVKNTPWKNGKGDVVKELAEACKEYGLKLGIYVSPWDRNHPDYGKSEYITYFRNQLSELLTGYGPIFEVWFDGANGGSGYYGGANENRKIDRTTYYDWSNTYRMIRKLQPEIVIWNDGGDRADLRWVGTEAGYVGETNWSLLNGTGNVEWNMLHYGLEDGDSWVPAEVNTSIRPEWFYHPGEDHKVKTVSKLMDTYYHSIGRNATLLLNLPVMPNGLIHQNDEQAVLEFAREVGRAFAADLTEKARANATHTRGNQRRFNASKAIDNSKDTYWTTDDSVKRASLILDFGEPISINRVLIQEYIRLGQRVKAFTLEAYSEGNWQRVAEGTTIGYKRILRFKSIKTSRVRFTVADSKACPIISNIEIYNAPQILDPPSVIRNQAGDIIIEPSDPESDIYFTVDGSKPTNASTYYENPIPSEGKINVRAIAYDPAREKASPETIEKFDLSRAQWQVLNTKDTNAAAILDGDPETAWHQEEVSEKPVDLVIDTGYEHEICGFRYFPDQALWGPGIITHYALYISADNRNWELIDRGEFSNIKNNPQWQTKRFDPVTTRYIRFRGYANTDDTNNMGYAEFDLITP